MGWLEEMSPQCDLVAHGATWHEKGSFLAGDLCDVSLERGGGRLMIDVVTKGRENGVRLHFPGWNSDSVG